MSTFSALSFNLWCHVLVGGANALQRIDKLVDEVVAVHCPSVIMLQEVFVAKLLFFPYCREINHAVARLQGLGYQCHHSQSSSSLRTTVPWFIGQNSGLLFFTRSGIQVLESREIQFDVTGEKVCNKGFQIFKVQVAGNSRNGKSDDGPIGIINCHLDAWDNEVKRDQISQILAAAQANGVAIVAGDFNICQQPIWDDGNLYKTVAADFSKINMSDCFGDSNTITFPLDRACYDHCFTSSAALTVDSHAVIDGTGISDHHGLFVKFSFPPKTPVDGKSSNNSLAIKTLQPSDDGCIAACCRVLTNAFVLKEPLCLALQTPAEEFYPWCLQVVQNVCGDGVSYYVEDKQNNNAIVGVAVCETFGAKREYDVPTDPIISDLLSKLDSFMPQDVFVSKSLHIFMVASDGSRPGVTSLLLHHILSIAKRRLYKYVFAELTSPILAHVFLDKFGFESKGELVFEHDFPASGLRGSAKVGLKKLFP